MSQVTLRRLVLAAAASAAALAATPATYAAAVPPSVPLAPPPVRSEDAGDHLVVTVAHAGAADGTYEVSCHPDGGSHPDVRGACDRVDRGTKWGKDPFAPVPEGSLCTMQYGGPATAHVTGRWAGRPVDASYDRGNGCEIARWDDLVPLLPDLHV